MNLLLYLKKKKTFIFTLKLGINKKNINLSVKQCDKENRLLGKKIKATVNRGCFYSIQSNFFTHLSFVLNNRKVFNCSAIQIVFEYDEQLFNHFFYFSQKFQAFLNMKLTFNKFFT